MPPLLQPAPLVVLWLASPLFACSFQSEGVSAVGSSSSSSGGGSSDPAPTTGTGAPLSSTGTSGAPATTTEADAETTTGSGSTTSTTSGDRELCGNGVLDPGEGCDLSYESNSDSGACTLQCQPAVCGDGLVWAGHEACDRAGANNDTLYGACTTSCELGDHCGDSVVNRPYEECDHGALNNTGESPPGGVPCTACRLAARLAFVSSTPFLPSQLGGLTGADLRCQKLAEDAGYDNSTAFRAWLSAGPAGPAARFTHGPETNGVPYALPDGRRIADDWNDLVTHGPDDGITITELGAEALDSAVWTNTDAYGEPFDPDNICNGGSCDCDNWTSDSPLLTARVGRSGVDKLLQTEWDMWQAERQWTSFKNLLCKFPLQIYCFEQ